MPSSRNRSQSGSSHRSPAFGREEALGRGVRADHQRDLGQAGQDPGPRGVEGLGAGRAGGVRRGDPGAVPARGPGRTSRRRRSRRSRCAPSRRRPPGRRRASRCRRRRARPGPRCTPYSVNGRPHLPHGCMPTPRTATSCAHWSASSPSSVTGFQRQTEAGSSSSGSTTSSTSAPTLQVLDAVAVGDLAQHDDPLGQLDRGERERLVGVGARRRTAPAAGTARRCSSTPSRAGSARRSRTPRRRRPGCGRSRPVSRRRREEDGRARRAPRPEQRRLRPGREPPLDRWSRAHPAPRN